MPEIASFDANRRHGHPDARAKRRASRAGTTHARFIRAVASAGVYPASDAEAYAVAVIATLEERLPLGEVYALEAQLPTKLHEILALEPILDLPTMDGPQLCARVAMRLGVTREEARSIARVVFAVLRERISAGEARHVEVQLPVDLRALWSGSSAGPGASGSDVPSPIAARVLEQTRVRSGLSTTPEVERAITATLYSLGERLSPETLDRLGRTLPIELAVRFGQRARKSRPRRGDDLYTRIAQREHVTLGFALEHAQAVCRALTAELPDKIVALIRRDLGPELAHLFSICDEGGEAPYHLTSAGPRDSTLASGRPGSRHPIAEARPMRGHTESIARSKDPHAATKLSSSKGTTQERERETLAAGRVGSTRPLSSFKRS